MKKILLLFFSIALLNNFYMIKIEAKEELNQKYVELRSDVKEWKYKMIDGKLYKRLWNGTKQRWETDWIPV